MGLEERYHTVTLNVSNNEVETLQLVLLEETIERLSGEFCKYIKVRITRN